jgi:hypothetical protein
MKVYFTRFVLALILLLIVVLVTPVHRGAQAQTAIDGRFGAVESFWTPAEAAELGVGWERILFYWEEIQKFGPDHWNTLHVLEEWLDDANAHGRTVVGLLKSTPPWATDGPPYAGVPRGLYLPVDDPENLWANYVRRVAAYYGPLGVQNWIIWNEPDIAPNVYGHEFSGSMEDYYRLLKVAYLAIKEVDPNATIHLGGMTYWHDPTYLRRFLQLVAADPSAAANDYYFDVVSLHIYFCPETMPVVVANALDVQTAVGIDPPKPVWINETNARPSSDPEWPVQVLRFPLDLDQQAWYIVQAFALGFYAGAERIAVYKLLDIHLPPGGESWGLLRPHDKSKRPAYYAYQASVDYLGGFRGPVSLEESPGHYIARFERPGGTTRVLWTRTTEPVTVEVATLAEPAMLVNATGDTVTPITAVDGRYTVQLEGARPMGGCSVGDLGGPPLFLVEGNAAAMALATATPPATATATATATPVTTATPLPLPSPSPATTLAAAATPAPPVAATAMALAPESGGQNGFADQLGLWFLGMGIGVALLLLVFSRRR